MRDLLYFGLYITDGFVWLLGSWFVLTGFFGYKAPKSSKRPILFGAAILIYAVMHLLLQEVSLQHNQLFGVHYEVILLFTIIYWMCQPVMVQNGVKKLRIREKLLLVVCAVEMVSEIMIIFSWGNSLLSRYISTDRVVEKMLAVYLTNLLAAGSIWLLARVAGKNRKESMPLSLCFLTFLFFMLLDTAIAFLQPTGYTDIAPFMRLRILVEDTENLDEVMGISVFIIVVVVGVLVLYALMKGAESLYLQKKNAVNESYLEMQKKHYESLMESNREIRKIKHDMKNHMYCIEQLCTAGRYEELESYIKEISEGLEHADIMVHTGCEIADAIISERKKTAQKLGIELRVEGDMYHLELSALHICTIFSNLLDNAIEAVEKLKGTEKWIELQLKRNHNFTLICVSNPIEDKVDIVENRVQTTKADAQNHGFGISNIKEAVAKYEGDVKLSQKDNVFRVEIMIPNSLVGEYSK